MRYLIALTFIGFIIKPGFAQSDSTQNNSPYSSIPEIAKQIKVEEEGIKIEKVDFQYIPDYKYEGGIIFGSKVQLKLDNIQGISSFEGKSYVLKRTRIIGLANQDTLINEDWQFADRGRGYELSDGEDLIFRLPLTVGAPMYSGDYRWELDLADMCSKKKVSVGVNVKVISNPNIQIITKGDARVRETYFYMTREQEIITSNKVPASILEFKFDGIQGFKKLQNKYNIGLALEIFNDEQESIMKIDDAAPNEMGIKKPVAGMLNVGGTFKFTNEFKGKKFYIVAQVWDKNGSGATIIGKTLIGVI